MGFRLEVWVCCTGALLAACGTDARGVTECREIEKARCAAAVDCGYPDQLQCERFVHDHCLHGVIPLTVDAIAVTECREAIEAAATCAQVQGPDTLSEDCTSSIEPTFVVAPTVCELIIRPELAVACVFLEEEPAEEQESQDEERRSSGDAGPR